MLEKYDDMLTVSDVREILKIGMTKVYNLFRDERFPSIKNFGGKHIIARDKFIEWVNDASKINENR
jgi:hypothetical protein